MKKILVTSLIIGIAAIGTALANDCPIVRGTEGINGKISVYESNENKDFLLVLPSTGVKQALTNLKAYCCSRPMLLICSDEEKNNLPKQYYPESDSLFDHLVDVAMRRLDGVTGLAYNLVPDPTGLEWRGKITEIAKSATGAQAGEIKKLFIDYRTLHDKFDTIKKNYNKNIATVSLGDKYKETCKLMREIYEKLGFDTKSHISDSSMIRCENIIQNRINREWLNTKILMIQKANQLLDEGIKAYTQKHFVQEKMMALRNIVTRMQDVFKTMVQQAPASKTCNR